MLGKIITKWGFRTRAKMLMQECSSELKAAEPVFRGRVALLTNLYRSELIDPDPFLRSMVDDPFQHEAGDLMLMYSQIENVRNADKARNKKLHRYKQALGNPGLLGFFDQNQTLAMQRALEVWMATLATPLVKNGLDYVTRVWDLMAEPDSVLLEAHEEMSMLDEMMEGSMGLPTEDGCLEICRHRPAFLMSQGRRETEPAPEPRDSGEVTFKSNAAAFEYCCRFMDTRLREGSPIAAMVLDAKEHLGAKQSVPRTKAGLQQALLQVAGVDGGFRVIATTRSGDDPRLKAGDLVMWVASEYSKEIGRKFKDTRGGWIGTIAAKIEPTVSPAKGWKVERMY